MSDQKVCPTCGTEYPLSERFCPRDGTALRSSSATGDLIGSIVAERYHILRKLGEGGMGTVYLAEHVKMGRKAALKVMNPGMNSDPDAIARFNREAANASRLNHPNVCAIYDFGETPDGLIYLAMEFIEGESLTSLIAKNGYLPAPRAAAIIHQAADALAAAHDQGIVHRDLKPDNIMIAKARDGSDVVKVVDFGIAKASSSDAQRVTKTGLVVGTPEYMSPEQLAGDKLDGRSDIYSLGLVAFNALTGLLPFASESAQETMIMRLTDRPKTMADVRPDVDWPPELQAVMDKVLQRDVNERYQKSAEFGRDMAKAVEKMPAAVAAAASTVVIGAPAERVPPTRPAPKAGATAKIEVSGATPAAKKSPAMLIVAAVVVIAAIGGGVMFMKGGSSATAPPTKVVGPAGAADSSQGKAVAPTSPAAPPNAGATGSGTAQTSQKSTVQQLSKPLPTATAPAGNPRPNPPAETETPAGIVDRWLTRLSDSTATAQDAALALTELNPLISKLTGQDRSNALYAQMFAYGLHGDDEEMCKVARQVAESDRKQSHVLTAKAALDARKCQ